MSQHENAKPRAPVWVATPFDESSGGPVSVLQRVPWDRAYLKVVEYPWGVEFEVEGDQE